MAKRLVLAFSDGRSSARHAPCDVFFHRGGEGVAHGAMFHRCLHVQTGAAVRVLRHGDVEVQSRELAALFLRLRGDGDAACVEVVLLARPCNHAEHAGGHGGGEHVCGAGVLTLAARGGLNIGDKLFLGRREDGVTAHVPGVGGDGCCVHEAYRSVSCGCRQSSVETGGEHGAHVAFGA